MTAIARWTSLRALAADYADGRVDRKTFTRERRRIIDGIVAGEIPLPPEEVPPSAPGVDPADEDITIDAARQRAAARAAPPAAGRRTPWIGVAAAIALVTVAVLGVKRMTTPPPMRPTIQATAAVPPVVARFLAANRWDEAALQRFAEDWRALTGPQRDALRASPAMSQLADHLQTRWNEARALLALGDRDNALAAQRRLLDLARTLGIGGERLDRMEAEWRALTKAPPQRADHPTDP